MIYENTSGSALARDDSQFAPHPRAVTAAYCFHLHSPLRLVSQDRTTVDLIGLVRLDSIFTILLKLVNAVWLWSSSNV